MEFLMGRALENNLLNLGLLANARELLGAPDLEVMLDEERDPALGNGGLGRLAACFLDSLATLNFPAIGYGINYEFGLFRQSIDSDGNQREQPDNWLPSSSPWLIERADEALVIPVYGRVEHGEDRVGNYNPMWVDWKVLVGVPHDMPVVGYGNSTVNALRLFSARASTDFDIEIFNDGDYIRAIQEKLASETVSKVLYPTDGFAAGRELRLVQEYFLVACAVRDVSRRLKRQGLPMTSLSSLFAIQLNDTHPALTVAELMRLLVDEEQVPWEQAWEITENTLAYTNHTLMPEALEKWPLELMQHVIPRHVQIILEINHRFLEKVAAKHPGDGERVRRMSIIEESEPKQVRMAHLSIVGSHSVNGVAAVHSDLVRTTLVPDFAELWPERFNNKTNGVTPRRWIKLANPGLSSLLDESIGTDWVTNLDKLRALERFAEDAGFQDKFTGIKRANKARLADLIYATTRIKVDPTSLFDVQIKRIHEYKRQLLNCLRLIHCYLRATEDGDDLGPSRTVVFAGKAAPGYFLAKLIIRLIHDIAAVINNDSRMDGRLKVVFLPDYRVSLAERIVPGADLSEQISTAGTEASGTGNMKLAMNGALTVGTLDGANIEIAQEVGLDNIYIFGKRVEEVEVMRRERSYNPGDYYQRSEDLRRVIDALQADLFCPSAPGLHRPLIDRVLHAGDEYLHLADFDDYLLAQKRAAADFSKSSIWARKTILNVARMGKFSSDRTILEYAREIWGLRATNGRAESSAHAEFLTTSRSAQ